MLLIVGAIDLEIISTNAKTPFHNPYVYPMFDHSANHVEFIRENKSPEGQKVEYLVFGFCKSPMTLRETRNLDRTMFISFLESSD